MTRHAASTITLAVTLLLTAGCSRGSAPTTPSEPAKTPAPAPPAGTSEPGAPMAVSFSTDDETAVQIAGDLYVPEKTPAPAVLALHQWNASRSTYADFAKAMRAAGFVVLTIDGRGFGGSTQSAAGAVEPGWNTQADIAAAVDYLKDQPSVDAQRIGIVGASYGASNALIFAADDPRDVRAVALLSVGLNYHDTLPTEPAVKAYGDRPLLMVAAKDDAESADATTKLAALAKGPKVRTQIFEKGGHGTALLAPDVGGTDLLKAFFVKNLTGPIAAPTSGSGGEEPGSDHPPGASAPATNGKGA